MPSQNHLTLFAQQLATWSEQIIENGRTPFRRVDLFHLLHTANGPCRPPLIFWINRQSMIAGGLLFLPAPNSDQRFEAETAATLSLGLRHFVTWAAEQIDIWQISADGNRSIAKYIIEATDDPATFHHRLYEIIDQLKLLSVTGRIEAEDIPPHYLLNLLTETLELALPALVDHCRSQRSEHASILSAEEEADSWNRLSLLRLLCLHHWQLIPDNLPVENLAATLERQLRLLPAPLGETLLKLTPTSQTTLPPKSAVAFHHLILRIQQIGWQKSSRGRTVLNLLLQLWYQRGTDKTISAESRLLFHSQELAPACQSEISHCGAQLAANCLWRTLHQEPQPLQVQGDAFNFNTTFTARALHANLSGELRPDPNLRRELAGHMRSSWPNRKLTIPGNLPFWAAEAVHMLGLTSAESRIELHLPSNWLRLLRRTFFCELLFSNFSLLSLDCRDNNRHLLTLQRQPNAGVTDCQFPDARSRSIKLGDIPDLATSRLIYTLELSPFLFDLMRSQHLEQLKAINTEDVDQEALILYGQSQLGQYLWRLQTENRGPITIEASKTEEINQGWLVPDQLHLRELKRLAVQLGKAPADTEINKYVTQLFDIPQEEQHLFTTRPARLSQGNKLVNRSLAEELLRQLEIDGIPHFPQTYLYRQATGPLSSYSFIPPLILKQEFLGEYELEDADKNILQVTGEETKEALLLASGLGLTRLEIPQDRQQTAEMLDSYRQDLRALQDKMTQLCHRHMEQPSAAQRLQKKLWQQLPLPPSKWLSS